MNTHDTTDKQPNSEEVMIRDQAIDWLFCLDNTVPEPDDPYRDLAERNTAFFAWVRQSATHLGIFLDLLELERRTCSLDATAVANIQRTIDLELAAQARPAPQVTPTVEAPPIQLRAPSVSRRPRLAVGMAAGLIAAAWGAYYFFKPPVYTTQFGEQQQERLSDGSFVHLNTESQVAVHFSSDAREVRLIRGEAYFTVRHDPNRPFTVISDDASVLAIGTEFDVRRSPQSTDVAVIEGQVQAAAVSPADQQMANAPKTSSPPARPGEAGQNVLVLFAGEVGEISSATVSRIPGGNVHDMVSWRQHRLDFHQARLDEVARQFNRYNRGQIRVEGAAAKETLVTATFKMNQIEDVIAYVQTKDFLSVMRDGDDIIIRSRE